MQWRELAVSGAWEVSPQVFRDDRGAFLEWFREGAFSEALGHPLHLAQANLSVSAVGVIRGIHFAQAPPGQAKYVTCPVGAGLDVVIDLRIGSPTFGDWDAVLLDDADRRAVYISEGLGHAFCSLEDGSTVIYLCSEPYAPEREHSVQPFDADLAIAWPTKDRGGRPLEHRLSTRDEQAPTLAAVRAAGLLPGADDVARYAERLRKTARS